MRDASKPILLIEDDQVDMMTVIRSLKQIHVTNPVIHRENGEDALNYLRDENGEKPCLILLDLNMPIMNGIEFLRAAKKDESRSHAINRCILDDQSDALKLTHFDQLPSH
ncbi:response regulator [Nitrosospira multiformis]|uniref:Response regulator receiver domain-containing protein n=1 Tax=Nitrosospira multiformis TaxID=1231 RepID=A0A1I7IRB2_9PROT|nr:response regulator [Nitrosospira multiformis]SFU75505.1 Response regulator receiver domain-containing protein [Nitrosospira multiformis]